MAKGFKMEKCEYCFRDRAFRCHNTRDMEDFAEDGDHECFFQLAKLGGGEKGLRYVILNHLKRKEISFKERVQAGLVEESKSDPIYQGGYTDGYEEGEQYGYLSGWNESNEAMVKAVGNTLIRKDITDAIIELIRGLRK